jgi:hypothetical protein
LFEPSKTPTIKVNSCADDQLDIAINRIEDDLYNALKNLKEKIGESASFNNFL